MKKWKIASLIILISAVVLIFKKKYRWLLEFKPTQIYASNFSEPSKCFSILKSDYPTIPIFRFKNQQHQESNLKYNLSPESRCVKPSGIFKKMGNVKSQGLNTEIEGSGAFVVYDFKTDVSGQISFVALASSEETIGVAFTESSDFVGIESDSSNGGSENSDGAILFSIKRGKTNITLPKKYLRGGFRYLTIFLKSKGPLKIDSVVLDYSAAPLMEYPNRYPNYFYSNDELINKIWYSGAYTLQTNIIDPSSGRIWPAPSEGWNNSALIAQGASVIVDGAKRDRAIWAGDLAIALSTAFVVFNDMISIKNTLTQIYRGQLASGEFPMVGPPINFFSSDTYHLWTLIATYDYALASNDRKWINEIWGKFKLGLQYLQSRNKGSNQLFFVTGKNDWARHGQGGENLSANVLYYRALVVGAQIAKEMKDIETAFVYEKEATKIKEIINSVLWDNSKGAFKDNPSGSLFPQDGNSLAVWFGVSNSLEQSKRVSQYLKTNWNSFGSITPEWNHDISNFSGSMEIQAHFNAYEDNAALSLIRTQWGYMLNNSRSTQTFWEGFLSNGEFGYGQSYMSHSHGWATGPTFALTFFVLGIKPLLESGLRYSVIPHPGDLTHVEGSLSFSDNRYVLVNYDTDKKNYFELMVNSKQNQGSLGLVAIPKIKSEGSVLINNKVIWKDQSFTKNKSVNTVYQDEHYIYFTDIPPGIWNFRFQNRP